MTRTATVSRSSSKPETGRRAPLGARRRKWARVALDNPLFAQIVNTPEWTTTTWAGATRGDPYTTYTTSNQPLAGQPNEYSGAYGVKTGTTHLSGQNLVSAAGAESEDVIAVALGSDDSDTVPGNRFTNSRALLDFGLGR